MSSTPGRRRVECYLRGDTYGTYQRQQAVIERVEALESAGVLADSSVRTGWQRIPTPEQDSRSGAIQTYEEFRAWAVSNGYRLEPAFERRTRTYVGIDTVDEVIVFPVVSVAVYDGSDLTAVFPCSGATDDVHFTVEDCLDALERDAAGDWFRQFEPLSVDRVAPHLDPVEA